MASYAVNTSKHATTSAGVIDTVTVTGNKRGVRIQHREDVGEAGIWWTVGYTAGTTPDPATDGSVDGSHWLPAAAVDVVTEPIARDNETQVVVKVCSSGAVDYSVETW